MFGFEVFLFAFCGRFPTDFGLHVCAHRCVRSSALEVGWDCVSSRSSSSNNDYTNVAILERRRGQKIDSARLNDIFMNLRIQYW